MLSKNLSNTFDVIKLYQNKYPIPATAEYVIDYVCDIRWGKQISYYQIVRLRDDAILYANESRTHVIMECWRLGLPFNRTAFI